MTMSTAPLHPIAQSITQPGAPDELEARRRLVALMDLTSLNPDDTDARIAALCRRASTPLGLPAALCIGPDHVAIAASTLSDLGLRPAVRLATVANFPAGTGSADTVVPEVLAALEAGADEIDVVLPWQRLIAGDLRASERLVQACRAACGDHVLKVIIESGELARPTLIRTASAIALEAGADFIKTSTGKVAVNATPEAARLMLEEIAARNPACGFKAAGGLRTQAQAQVYLDLAAELLGPDWVDARHLRLGASGLLDQLLSGLGPAGAVAAY